MSDGMPTTEMAAGSGSGRRVTMGCGSEWERGWRGVGDGMVTGRVGTVVRGWMRGLVVGR